MPSRILIALAAVALLGSGSLRAADVAGPGNPCEHRFTTALSGRLVWPVTVRVSCMDDDGRAVCFSFADRAGWHAGKTAWEPGTPPTVLLADPNFDGLADLWVTRCRDGQCRIATPDVWLFEARKEALRISRGSRAAPFREAGAGLDCSSTVLPATRPRVHGVGNWPARAADRTLLRYRA